MNIENKKYIGFNKINMAQHIDKHARKIIAAKNRSKILKISLMEELEKIKKNINKTKYLIEISKKIKISTKVSLNTSKLLFINNINNSHKILSISIMKMEIFNQFLNYYNVSKKIDFSFDDIKINSDLVNLELKHIIKFNTCFLIKWFLMEIKESLSLKNYGYAIEFIIRNNDT